MSLFRVFIGEADEIVRLGLHAILEPNKNWTICGEAEDGDHVVAEVERLKPDLVILGTHMGNVGGLEATRRIMKQTSPPRILIFTANNTDQVIRESLKAGAQGFVLKSDSARDITDAVKALQEHRTFFTSRVEQMVVSGYLSNRNLCSDANFTRALTPREQETVQLIASGKNSAEMALIMKVGGKTVDSHRTNIMHKLGVHSIAQLVLYAVRNNIVQIRQDSM
jgi:DNA-binding NarL/FixJ family response regulator